MAHFFQMLRNKSEIRGLFWGIYGYFKCDKQII